MNEEVKKETSILKKTFKFIFLSFFVLGILFCLYISYIEPNIIKVNEQAIVDTELPTEFNGFKIVHFSDIHYGNSINDKGIDMIAKKINELNPDIVVYTGDLLDDTINISETNIKNIKKSLGKINASIKKYAVIGDSDYVNKDVYLNIMNESGFEVLENENDFIYYKGNTPLMFIGTSSILEGENNVDNAILTDNNDIEYYKIWLNHEPAIFDTIVDKNLRPNLLLTGHTLGGLIDIPFYGYLLEQDGISKYKMDYYHKKKISMYISNGLGTYKYKVRFMNVPSINFYRLYNE